MQDALDYAAEQTQQALAALGSSTKKETTVWMDGAFDVMHFGHANAFRQGRTLGTRLVVGVNSSSTIEQAKGAPPLLTDEERCAAVTALARFHCPLLSVTSSSPIPAWGSPYCFP